MLSIGEKIIQKLPYSKPFLFVDEISFVDESKIIGHYTFKCNDFFYAAHFTHKPVTPGIILIEMMGQIGMVSHIIFLKELHNSNAVFHPVVANINASFLKQVNPEERLSVESEKVYFRNDVLKSNIKLFNSMRELCAIIEAQVQLIYD